MCFSCHFSTIPTQLPALWYFQVVPQGRDSPADVQLQGDAVKPAVCQCSRALTQQGFRDGNPRGARAACCSPPQVHPGRLYPKIQVQCFKPTVGRVLSARSVSELGFFPPQLRLFSVHHLRLSLGHLPLTRLRVMLEQQGQPGRFQERKFQHNTGIAGSVPSLHGGGEGETPPTKAGMEEALLGWILVGLGFESSTCPSGDVFALCRGCSWSHPGAESGSVSWQESPFPLLSLRSPTPLPLLVSRLAPLCCFFGTLSPGHSHPLGCWEQNNP